MGMDVRWRMLCIVNSVCDVCGSSICVRQKYVWFTRLGQGREIIRHCTMNIEHNDKSTSWQLKREMIALVSQGHMRRSCRSTHSVRTQQRHQHCSGQQNPLPAK